ncbi:unnamed protein product [Cylindrotheca closterium]|uniref:Uncharacterized protein n=1 Tax=Cylindrotheca closterium TaxID=2856 RepID=A0AAD2PVU5_9STRA|nr:unnamed protein product [Cylindrotheca closterium]
MTNKQSRSRIMATVNQADESGGKPASNGNTANVGSNVFVATANDANSSFALLQQVQSILLENNEAKTKMVELENQMATFQKEREALNRQLDENEKDSEQKIQSLQQQLSLKEEQWSERYETQERNHKSSLQKLQTNIDDWESQHQDWIVQKEQHHDDASKLKEEKIRLESQVQQIKSTLEESEADARRLRQHQEEATKTHQEKVDEMNSRLESTQNDLEAQRLQQKNEKQSHEEQERKLSQTIKELQTSAKAKDASLQSLNDVIKELRLEASQLKQSHQTQVDDMEGTIANLEQENVAQSRQAEEYQTEIEKLQEEMDSLKSVFLEQQKRVEEKEEYSSEHEDQEDQESKWQDLVQSLQIQVQAQTNVAETQGQELEEAKSQNMQLRVQLQVASQQKEQLERSWNETKEKLNSLEERLSRQSDGGNYAHEEAAETTNSLHDQQTRQEQEIASLMEKNSHLNDRIVQMEAQLVLGGSRSYDHSESKDVHSDQENGMGNDSQDGNHDTIAQLQQRIMHLVEEKLILQTAVETLEHEFMESDLLERNAVSRQLQQKRSPAMAIKEYWHDHQLELQKQQEPPTIVVDENTKQADIIRQTLEHRQSQKLSRRISEKVRGHPTKPKATQQIDVKATKQLFLQEQQKQELIKKAQAQKRTNLSNARPTAAEIGRSNWVRSRDHGVASKDTPFSHSGSTDLPEYLGPKQHGFVQSAASSSNTKEKTTTWTRIRDSIAGSKTNKAEGEARPSDVDDFSQWVQELSQEQQSAEVKESQQPEEFKSLSVPASMLDPMPISSNTGRYAVQSIDDMLNEGASGGVEGLTKKLGKREETHAEQTYRVAAPVQSKKTHISKEESQTAAMGQGKAIDQSNLLGFYVSKQKEAANSTTIGYLSSMIYGDPEEEEAKIQKKLLKRQLAQKKKQEQREREQLKQAVQGTIKSKPKTLFSSFV